jgi:farnesyl diphosphate synthase
MALSQRLVFVASLVEARLASVLDEAARGGAPARLVAAMRHAALGGGKRFRPFLVAESAALFDVPVEAALAAASALECVHCYSLVHDDLPAMDSDDMRRGRPTVHRAFDEWTAILAGDALLTLAFEILARSETHPDAAIRAELALGLARAAGAVGMAGGQCLDLESAKLENSPLPVLPEIDRLQAMKTGALLAYACEAGAILGRAGSEDRRALALFGARLGRAYQIADDLLDLEGEPHALGKATGKDAAARKATLHAVVGVEAARACLSGLEAEAVGALDRFGAKADGLREAARFAISRRS